MTNAKLQDLLNLILFADEITRETDNAHIEICEYVTSLEQRNAELEQRVKELEECTDRMISKEKALIHHMINKKQDEVCKNCTYHGEISEDEWGVCSNTDSWLFLEDTPYHATCKYYAPNDAK